MTEGDHDTHEQYLAREIESERIQRDTDRRCLNCNHYRPSYRRCVADLPTWVVEALDSIGTLGYCAPDDGAGCDTWEEVTE